MPAGAALGMPAPSAALVPKGAPGTAECSPDDDITGIVGEAEKRAFVSVKDIHAWVEPSGL